jgi:hypothetical protein
VKTGRPMQFFHNTSVCLGYLLDGCLIHSGFVFNILFVLSAAALAGGSWAFIAVFFVLIVRGWIMIKNYCYPVHNFTVYYICNPVPLLGRFTAAALAFCLIFPVCYLVILLIIHSIGFLIGIINVPVSLRVYILILINLFSIISLAFFAGVLWPKEQIKKLVSVLLGAVSIVFIIVFIYLRIRLNRYFSSFLGTSDMEGLISEISRIFSVSSAGLPSFPLSHFINIVWFLLVPVSSLWFSYRKLKNIGSSE